MIEGIQAQAEQKMIERINRLREKLVVAIADQTRFDGLEGRGFRITVRQLIDDEFRTMPQDLFPSLEQAWYAGIGRASLGSAISESYLPMDLAAFRDLTEIALKRLRNDIVADILHDLTMSIDSPGARESIISKMGSQLKRFRQYEARAVGIASHMTDIVEAKAHAERTKELAKQRYEKAKMDEALSVLSPAARASQLIQEGRRPVEFKVWAHSKKGNPPRANHLAMHGKAVVIDQQFKLTSVDGVTVLNCDGPKDPDLPIEETARCRCVSIGKTLFLTQEEEKDYRKRCAETGGILDDKLKL
jgi:hypothetical protein